MGYGSSVIFLAAGISASLNSAPGAAQNSQPAGAPSSATEPGSVIRSAEAGAPLNDEIIVTAQKREENLQNVPVPVSVIPTAALVQSNQVLIKDYATAVPAFSVTPVIGSEQSLSLRGITTGGQAIPTVGVLVDDIPFGDSTRIYVPDFDPGDLARVEVLRGPQGTLYGANSMGGLLKYDTIQPNSTRLSGSVSGGLNGVHNGRKAGFSIRGAVNAPLTDNLALRVSAFDRTDPGYVDNVLLGKRAINEARVYGGRAALRWAPSNAFTVTLRGLYQHSHEDASSDVNLGLGDLQQAEVAGAGLSTSKLQAYSATMKAKIGLLELVSLTGYSVNQTINHNDLSSRFGRLMQRFYGVGGAVITFPSKTKKYTQEVRGSLPLGQHLDATVGAFYTHENVDDLSYFQATDPLTGRVAQNYVRFHEPLSTYKEYAAFGDLDYRLNEAFDVQFGIRASHIINDFAPYEQSPRFTYRGQPGITPDIITAVTEKASPINYLITPRYKISQNAMLYFRFATGYRPGGANPGSPNGVPAQFGPDQTKNYEFGAKASMFDHRLTFDASVYYIDWSKIQIQLQLPVCADALLCPNAGQLYEGNGGSAKSEGVEFSATLKPVTGMTLGGWFAYNNAVLTQDFPAGTFGVKGDRLPFSARVSWHLSAEQRFRLASTTSASIGGDVSYVGNRVGLFQGVGDDGSYPPRHRYPSYTTANIHASVFYGSVTVSAYVNNLFDKRALLSDGGDFQPTVLFFVKPRTFGMSIAKSF